MATIPKDDVREFNVDESQVLVDDEVLINELIESFEGRYDDLANVLRAVNRVFRIKTTDLVDNGNMIGARVTFVDRDGDPHRAVVLEPEVSDIPANEAFDPRKDEMVDPSEYPTGTVQLIYGDGGEFGGDDYFFDRASSLQVATSVMPAKSPDSTYCYFAGWDYYEKSTGDD